VIDYARAGDKERMNELEGPLGAHDIVRDFASNKGSQFRACAKTAQAA
jgi:hypothetical protein